MKGGSQNAGRNSNKRSLTALSQSGAPPPSSSSSSTYANASPTKAQRTISSQGEVILFKTPLDDSCLYVNRLHRDTTDDELRETFSRYGLLHDLRLYETDSEDRPYNYAFVRYYSVWSAIKALHYLERIKFHGVTCKVIMKKRNLQNERKQLPLTIQRCIDVANYYIGFDGWSSSIVTLAPAEELSFDAPTKMYKCVFKCVVRYSFKSYDRVLEAIGFGMHEGLQRGETIEYAKKKAVTEAYKNAFQSMAIILLRTGKVALHFLDTSVDQWTDPVEGEEGAHPGEGPLSTDEVPKEIVIIK